MSTTILPVIPIAASMAPVEESIEEEVKELEVPHQPQSQHDDSQIVSSVPYLAEPGKKDVLQEPDQEMDSVEDNSTPSSPASLEPYDWDDFESRYQAELNLVKEEENEALAEFDQLLKVDPEPPDSHSNVLTSCAVL
jgi:hypothetical protein